MSINKFYSTILLFSLLLILVFTPINYLSAVCSGTATFCGSITDGPQCTATAGCVWTGSVQTGTGNTDNVELPNPLGSGRTDINAIIGTAINAVLGLVGSIALVMFIYGGFTWMTAAGNKEAVTKGKDIIIWSVAGLAVIFLAYAVVNFVLTDVIGGM